MPVDLTPEVASNCLWFLTEELRKTVADLGEDSVPDAEELTLDQRDFLNNMGSRLRMLTTLLSNSAEYV